MLNTLSVLMLVRRSGNIVTPFVYQIIARMLSFIGKLTPVIKDIIISDCTFEGKRQF